MIPFTGLVNNTHLLQYTDINTLASGLPLAEEITKATGIPMAFNSVFKSVLENASPEELEVF